MNKHKLFIPKRIRVGFQNRSDTYNGKLSYIIYYDETNKLRKEHSFNSWRDSKIDVEEYDNTPKSGFLLHKDIQRYNWNHFSTSRTMIRVFDPNGLEFEITTDNLLFILQHTNCIKRELEGEFVYSWLGKELILLPVNTEEYTESSTFTDLQNSKLSAKDLQIGRSYKTKDLVDVVYLGLQDWYEVNNKTKIREKKRYHIFTANNGETFITKTSASNYIVLETSNEIVLNYANIVDKFNENLHSSELQSYELIKTQLELNLYDNTDLNVYKYFNYFVKFDNDIYRITIQVTSRKNYNGNIETLYSISSLYQFDSKLLTFDWCYYKNTPFSLSINTYKQFLQDEFYKFMSNYTLYDLYITLKNGKVVKC